MLQCPKCKYKGMKVQGHPTVTTLFDGGYVVEDHEFENGPGEHGSEDPAFCRNDCGFVGKPADFDTGIDGDDEENDDEEEKKDNQVVINLVNERAEAIRVLEELIEWDVFVGSNDAPCWKLARQFVHKLRKENNQ